nr:MAG TPA: hypothetical protein [Caudoviricetes sp.]
MPLKPPEWLSKALKLLPAMLPLGIWLKPTFSIKSMI